MKSYRHDLWFDRIGKAGASLIEARRGLAFADVFRKRGQAHYAILSKDAPIFSNSMNKRLFVLGVPLLSYYKALREDLRMEQEEAVSLLEQILVAAAKPMAESALGRLAINMMYQVKPIRELGFKPAYEADEPLGFRFEKVEEPGVEFGFNVRECALMKYMVEKGAPEIMPMICRMDDLSSEQLIGMKLVRSGTIGMGASQCDFRYVKLRKKGA